MDKRLLFVGALLLLCALFPLAKASPEAVFRWESSTVKEGETGYIEFYQNFKQPYNFTVISDLVEECWVINDYYDENKVVCRSEMGLCKSMELIEYQYVKCKTWNIYREDAGKKAVLFYEYENDWGRQNGVYQTQALKVPIWTGKIIAAGPFMTGLIASMIVIVIILVIIYFAGSYLVSWFRDVGSERESYQEELQTVKEQIGKKGQVFPNCTVIY